MDDYVKLWGEAGKNFAKMAYEYYHDQLNKQSRTENN